MVAISRKMVTVYIAPVDTDASDVATSDAVDGEISDYSLTGGQSEVESTPVFGGFVDKEKAREQYEFVMEVIPKVDSNQDRWDSYIYGEDGSNAGVYTSADEAADRAVFIEAYDSNGSTYKSYAFNNCNGVQWDFSHAADDNRVGTLTFKFSPTTSVGVPNFMTQGVQVTSLPDWSALDTE